MGHLNLKMPFLTNVGKRFKYPPKLGGCQIPQPKPEVPHPAGGAPVDREAVKTLTEVNVRSALSDPQSGHRGASPSE
jgi:hypothetical protein